MPQCSAMLLSAPSNFVRCSRHTYRKVKHSMHAMHLEWVWFCGGASKALLDCLRASVHMYSLSVERGLSHCFQLTGAATALPSAELLYLGIPPPRPQRGVVLLDQPSAPPHQLMHLISAREQPKRRACRPSRRNDCCRRRTSAAACQARSQRPV